ncbi:MAG: hypothetical protein HPM95_00345 [Alphaproteobacteria bacterium]|nr:hypothetical protein [Alphaproteobacteria bacterium]
MSIAEGAYTDEEIAAIFTGLEPVDGQAARVLEAQSFAKLTYCRATTCRSSTCPTAVPLVAATTPSEAPGRAVRSRRQAFASPGSIRHRVSRSIAPACSATRKPARWN